MSAEAPSRDPWPLWSRAPVAIMLGAAVFLVPGDWSDTGPAMVRFALSALVIGVVGLSWWVVPFAGLAPLLALGFLDATDCPDCGGGGDELPAGAKFLMAVVGLTAFSVASGFAVGAARLVAWMALRGSNWRVPPVPTALVFAAPLLLATGGITAALVRKEVRDDVNGDIVYDFGDRRIREGREWDGEGTEQSMSEEEIRAFDEIPLFWLGTEFRSMNLIAALPSGNTNPTAQLPVAGGVAFIYGKCGPAPCAAPLQVHVNAICARPDYVVDPQVEILPSGLAVRRSPEMRPPGAAGDSVMLYTSDVMVKVTWYVSGITADEVLAALTSPNGASLGPPDAPPCP